MNTGLNALDSVVGDLGPGDFFCVAGRPCVGKTALLLDLVLRIHRRYETNIVFATAKELPEQIMDKVAAASRTMFVKLPVLNLLRGEVRLPAGRRPFVYVIDVQGVGPVWPHYIAHRLSVESRWRCDLLVVDGWSVSESGGTEMGVEVAGVPYRVAFERSAPKLSAATVRKGHELARVSGVSTVYGVTSARNDRQESGPRFEDLAHLQSAVSRAATRTVLVHRPELYKPDASRRPAGLMELTAVEGRTKKSWRAELRYDRARRTICHVAKGRGRASSADK
jgi:replicative DNA helicase